MLFFLWVESRTINGIGLFELKERDSGAEHTNDKKQNSNLRRVSAENAEILIYGKHWYNKVFIFFKNYFWARIIPLSGFKK